VPAPLLRQVHHTGIVTEDLDTAIALYERLFGASFFLRETLEDQGVAVAGEIELLSPLVEGTGVARFLAARGPGLHHTAYGVRNLPQALETLRAAGVVLIDAVPRAGAGGLRVAFLHPRSTGHALIELVETPRGEGDGHHA